MVNNTKKKQVGYQSEIDKFFHEFDDKRDVFPESRQREVSKHEVIFKKRDNAIDASEEKLWNNF